MIRMYCDGCEKEIGRDVIGDRYRPVLEILHEQGFVARRICVDIMVGINGVLNGGGHLCIPCLKRAVTEGIEYPER